MPRRSYLRRIGVSAGVVGIGASAVPEVASAKKPDQVEDIGSALFAEVSVRFEIEDVESTGSTDPLNFYNVRSEEKKLDLQLTTPTVVQMFKENDGVVVGGNFNPLPHTVYKNTSTHSLTIKIVDRHQPVEHVSTSQKHPLPPVRVKKNGNSVAMRVKSQNTTIDSGTVKEIRLEPRRSQIQQHKKSKNNRRAKMSKILNISPIVTIENHGIVDVSVWSIYGDSQ